MADERLPLWRPMSMLPTRSDSVIARVTAISFRPFQNASSRLTLVLCPAITIERFTTGDFIGRLLCRFGAGRDPTRISSAGQLRVFGRAWADRGQGDSCARALHSRAVWLVCAPPED